MWIGVSTRGHIEEVHMMPAKLAAAASVPSSVTSAKALCRIWSTANGIVGLIPESVARSASNKLTRPSACSTGFRSNWDSMRNRGSFRSTNTLSDLAVRCSHVGGCMSLLVHCSDDITFESALEKIPCLGKTTYIPHEELSYGSQITWKLMSSK